MLETPAPAVGVSVVTDVARGRQITVQTFYPLGTPKAEIDKMLDELLAPVDRQKALAEMPDLEADLTKAKQTLEQFREDLAMVDINHASAQAKRGVELDEITALKNTELEKAAKDAKDVTARGHGAILTATQQAEAEFRAGNRRGEFVLKGHHKQSVDQLRAEVEKTTEHNKSVLVNLEAKYDADIAAKQREIDNADGDKLQHKQQLGVSVVRFEAEIARLVGEIDNRRKIAAG